MSQWGLLSREPDLDIWDKTNSCVKVSVSGRTSILFHKVRSTMMIWKQRAKLVMATARWALKHPVHGIVIYCIHAALFLLYLVSAYCLPFSFALCLLLFYNLHCAGCLFKLVLIVPLLNVPINDYFSLLPLPS